MTCRSVLLADDHAGRILKGAKPRTCRSCRQQKLELVIYAGTARMLGLDVPPTLLARADEGIARPMHLVCCGALVRCGTFRPIAALQFHVSNRG